MINNVPLTLTLVRLIASPLVLPFLLVYLLPFNNLFFNSILAGIFIALSLTDFFDGYLARRYGQETMLGKLLDPIADKFLHYTTLIGLLVAHKIFFYWVVLLIGRELFVMGLRQIALEYHSTVPVSYLGKIKTALHTFCFTYLIINPYQSFGLCGAPVWNGLDLLLVVSSVFISLYSAYSYCLLFIEQFNNLSIRIRGDRE